MQVKKVEGALMAAKRFSGLASDELFERKAKKLLEELKSAAMNLLRGQLRPL